jgi:nicotinamide mononucleotide (NMN) deamidase PncC
MRSAGAEHFLAGFISNGTSSLRAFLGRAREPDRLEQAIRDPAALTDELAWCARAQAGSDFGLALHSIPDPKSQEQNLARGETYVSVTDGKTFKRFTSTMAGRGQYDRTRMTLNAIDLLRRVLIEGMG